MNSDVLKDVVFRTNGELYIGVVGAVRSGKSTFIRKFIDTKVTPFIHDEEVLNKLIDDLPQSSEGKTIMTVEPKFVPSNSAYISIDGDINMNIRLVDCVGYVIESAKGYLNEDGSPRLVKTPWKTDAIPFEEAAYLGTKKVIENHSHIGIVLTSDGSFGEFTREDYQNIEDKLISEMKELNKPFVVVLNSANPKNKETLIITEEIKQKHDVSVLSVNCNEMTSEEIDKILALALEEFEITELDINVPNWLKLLDDEFSIKLEFNDLMDNVTSEFRKFKHVMNIKETLNNSRLFNSVRVTNVNSATGEVTIEADCDDSLYNEVLESIIGDAMNDKGKFIILLQEAIKAKESYSCYKDAINEAMQTGYGIAYPNQDSMMLESPTVIKNGSRYGVKLKAIAPSIHMIKIEVDSTFEPIIGSEEQSKILIEKIMADCENNKDNIWNSEIFGRKLSEVVNDGIKAKLIMIDENVKYKFKESLQKVVNHGKGGILAFIL